MFKVSTYRLTDIDILPTKITHYRDLCERGHAPV